MQNKTNFLKIETFNTICLHIYSKVSMIKSCNLLNQTDFMTNLIEIPNETYHVQ